MSWVRRIYPFNAEQTVNILSEFGPLVTMFIVNGIFGKTDPHLVYGTTALIVTTVIAMVVMRSVLGRFPVFPIIASSVTIVFGLLTLATGDPMWVQIKVSIFNAMFAGFLFGGLFAVSPLMGRNSLWAVLGVVAIGGAAQYPLAIDALHGGSTALKDSPLLANLMCIGSVVVGFMMGTLFRRNFFGHVFERTFHYTQEGWDRFTFSFAWFFIFTAVLNEVVRQVFDAETFYSVPVFGEMNGVNVWILFKIAFIMPISGIYAWYLTRLMHKYRLDAAPVKAGPGHAAGAGAPAE